MNGYRIELFVLLKDLQGMNGDQHCIADRDERQAKIIGNGCYL